jgi:hypothetical protein
MPTRAGNKGSQQGQSGTRMKNAAGGSHRTHAKARTGNAASRSESRREAAPRKSASIRRQNQEAGKNGESRGRGDAFELINMLKEDHQRVKNLLSRFESTEQPEERKRIADEAIHELEIHSEMEERLVYPLIEDEFEGETEESENPVTEAREEHHVVDLLIAELKKMKPEDNHFAAKFRVLGESVRHHIQEEESRLLPELEDTETDFGRIIEEARRMKEEQMAGAGPAGRGRSGGVRKASPARSAGRSAKTASRSRTR